MTKLLSAVGVVLNTAAIVLVSSVDAASRDPNGAMSGESTNAANAYASVEFRVDATHPGRTLPNTQQMICMWSLPKGAFGNVKKNPKYDVTEFAEFVEVMGATGGTYGRDCFKNPADRSVTDDYDFTRLVEGCRGILGVGLKPYLKLGNVPVKLSSKASIGGFGMNVSPPDDYSAYGNYMTACADALLAAFGREELCRWRFAVLTEFENNAWFKDVSGDSEKTFCAYCRLYETTVETFVKRISPDLMIGVHAMAVTEGLWDERRFIKYAAMRNLPLRFVTASFYDRMPGVQTDGMPLAATISHLRCAADEVGLTNLVYGVDEGRVLWGVTRSRANDNLFLRIVGDTYQAAYDARIVKQLFDSGADWFASWGYLSGPDVFFEGLPSVSFHVARKASQFKGMKRLPVARTGGVALEVDENSVAAISGDGRCVRIMAYAFKDDLFATGTFPMHFSVAVPQEWADTPVTLESCLIDDGANWFDEWRAERKRRGIRDDCFAWSPDDPAPMSAFGLKSAADREMFKTELEPRFHECSKPTIEYIRVAADQNGEVKFSRVLSANSVLFVELSIGDRPCVKGALEYPGKVRRNGRGAPGLRGGIAAYGWR